MTAIYDAKETQDLKQGKRGGPVIALRNIATGETFSLEDGQRRWLVGKDDTCDLRVRDPAVSGIHFILERRSDGAFLVRDRESTNGTMIDAHPIEAAELRSGSYITFGRTTLLAIGPASSVVTPPRAIEQWKGSDPKSRAVLDRAIKAAQTDCSVLVVGETGTGKDLVARMIHESSRRANGPFVAVNCGAIPRELIGSELFGHERGAFTGATESREGYFVEAHGGTLFLDEIGELPIELQPNLLRVLETRRVRRVGGAEKAVDVRIIAATNREANLGTDESPLRVDLYHRVATVVLKLPPLRERMSDLIDIVHSVMKEYPGAAEKTISKEAWHALSSYAWPGNVREVRHTVERAITLGGQELGPADFFSELATRGVPRPIVGASMLPYQVLMRASMERALEQHGTIRAAAMSIGMPKSTFADKAREFGIALPKRGRKRDDD